MNLYGADTDGRTPAWTISDRQAQIGRDIGQDNVDLRGQPGLAIAHIRCSVVRPDELTPRPDKPDKVFSGGPGCPAALALSSGRSVMSLIRQRRRRYPGGQVGPLDQLAAQPFSSADLVLLCSFGPDLVRPRTQRELRHALLLAGYRGPLGRHLILTSPLLQRRAGNRYVLQQFSP